MAASMDFFRSLGSGAKFDLKRFRNDAERFQIIKPNLPSAQGDITKTLDIFGNSATSSTSAKQDLPHKKVKKSKQSVEEVSKRKRDVGESVGRSRKRKKKKPASTDSANINSDSDENDSQALTHESFISADTTRQDVKAQSDHTDSSDNDDDETMDDSAVTLMSSFKDNAKQTSDDEEGNIMDSEMEQKDQARQNHLRAFCKQHRIHTLGTDVPDPLGTFREMQGEYRLHSDIVENIHRAGYAAPTPIQMQAIPVMIHRRELLACAPTGSGKTAAFILPVLHHLKEPRKQGFRAVVVSPSRELAHQTYREFMRLSDGRGFRIHMIDNTAKAAKKFGPQSAGKFDILVTTPNRLVYMLKQDPPTIKLNKVEWLIVDESDKLFEGGKTGFREQLATIYQACDSNQVRRAMFSATFTHEVEKWCNLNLDNLVTVTVGQRNAANDTVKQELMFVGDEYGKLLAVRDIFKKGFLPPVLIFVQSKERAKELFHELIYDGYNVDVIHADKSQVQRDNVVSSFRAGKIWVLIATELMGRGIDFKGVNLVINYDFPTSAISYIHRIGRTGRAGREGSAITMFTEDDIVQLRGIANVMRNAGCPVPEYMLQLKKLSKKGKKKLQKRAPRRKTIRTLPTSELERARMKKGMMKNKHRKDQSAESSSKSQASKKPGQKWPIKKKPKQQGAQDNEMFQGDATSGPTFSPDGFEKVKRTKTHKKLVKNKAKNTKGKNKATRNDGKKSGVKSGSAAHSNVQKKKTKV